jgi:hypothetical protein
MEKTVLAYVELDGVPDLVARSQILEPDGNKEESNVGIRKEVWVFSDVS